MTQKNTQIRSRGWCFTINNYTDDDIAYCMSLYENDYNCQYLIVGFEQGSRTQTKHIQGYIYYREAKSFSFVTKIFGTNHIEAQKSKTNVKAYCYCMEDKKHDYYEMGERPRQGHRTDLEVIKYDLKKGKKVSEIADEYFTQWLFHRKAFYEYRNLNSKFDTSVVFYFDHDIKDIYNYVNDDNIIMKEYDILNYHNFLHLYHSKKHKVIYMPYRFFKNNCANLESDQIKYTFSSDPSIYVDELYNSQGEKISQ